MVGTSKRAIPAAVSARHCHVCQKDLETLFGTGYKLTVLRPISQPGQYAAVETVTLKTEKAEIPGVRILGPVRPETQVEISLTDARKLGIEVPIQVSAKGGAGGVTLIGPKGQVTLKEGVIASMRHIHMTPADAQEFGVMDGELVGVKTEGVRGLIFENVLIRVRPDFKLEFQVDTDEANAAALKDGDMVTLIGPFRVPSGRD